MRIEVNGKIYDLSDFDDYEEIEALGEITGTIGIPDCVDIESDWDSIQEYLKLSDDEQAIMIAYAEATNTFDWSEASDAYVGDFVSGAEFADYMAYEILPELKDLPDWIAYHIDWQGVWDGELRHDYFEVDGLYFRNL